jgi:uncharacterized protein with FMN-binding domain
MQKQTKIFLAAGFVVVVLVVYGLNRQGASTAVPSPGGSASAGNSAKAAYKDGQYTGRVADAIFGNIQVRATIAGGKLTDVQFLQYPNDRRNSVAINTQAMPLLKQEAITAQAGRVDIVSGATDTSQAFSQSLGDALKQAQG